MPDILVRGLSDAAVARFEAAAAALGISRAEVLRRHLEADVAVHEPRRPMTEEDGSHFAQTYAGLADPAVMAAAWR